MVILSTYCAVFATYYVTHVTAIFIIFMYNISVYVIFFTKYMSLIAANSLFLHFKFEIVVFRLINLVISVWLFNVAIFKFSVKLSKLT